MESKTFAKVSAVAFMIVKKQKQRMTNNEGIAKLQLNTLQLSKNHVVKDY